MGYTVSSSEKRLDEMVSIAALIYRSPGYADSLWRSLVETVPGLGRSIEFFFLANNATDQLLEHLQAKKYPHRVRREPIGRIPAEIQPLPYMIDVYRGWNEAIRHAAGKLVVLLNSDHVFTAHWLDSLLAVWKEDIAVSPLMVEPGPEHFRDSVNGTGSLICDCGHHPSTFDRARFERFAESATKDALTDGGVFMPVLISRAALLKVGLYPEGNIRSTDACGCPGDQVLFGRLQSIGVRHVTCHRAICYHFMEGEMREGH